MSLIIGLPRRPNQEVKRKIEALVADIRDPTIEEIGGLILSAIPPSVNVGTTFEVFFQIMRRIYLAGHPDGDDRFAESADLFCERLFPKR